MRAASISMLRGVAVPLGLILVAEAAARFTGMQSDSLAAPSRVAAGFVELLGSGALQRATYETLVSAFSGLAIGFGIGTVIGILLGMMQTADRLAMITIEAVRPIPSVALIPAFTLIYGFGFAMEIATIAFATAWPSLVLSRAAIAGVEPRLFEVAKVLNLSLWQRITKLVLPAALPRIFGALRLGVGLALVVAVTVEISANIIGIGNRMMTASQSLQPHIMLAYLAWLGFLGWGISALMLVAQRSFFGQAGRQEQRS